MNKPIKKRLKKFTVGLLTLPIMFSGSLTASDKSVEDRIKKLEAMVMELKKQVKKKKSRSDKKADKSMKKSGSAKNTYKFGGFIKTTATWNDYSDGDIGAGSGLRDFYIPDGIPVGGNGEKDFDFGAKESRINWKSTHMLDNGSKLTTNIEFDFLFPAGGNERVSNSYSPRLRHAHFTYDNWLFGQTWSTFQNVGALPESADFLGASEGVVFNRQAVIRYTSGPFQIAIENPETTITTYAPYGGGGRIVSDDNGMPDFVLRYNHKAKWGHIAASVLLRQLAFDGSVKYGMGTTDTSDDITVIYDDTESSVGFSISGKFKVGKNDDIRFNYQSGKGMGRYVGLNTANGAVLDALGGLNAIDSENGAIAYRHVWGNGWRSSFIYSAIEVDNDASLTGTGVTQRTSSLQANLLYSPTAKVTFGVGLLDATRQLYSDVEGDMTRLIFTAKYAF